MILHPDFLDHWKTKKLIEILGDPAAPLLVIRLWAYCQKSKKAVFANMDNFRLKSVCHAQIDGQKLADSLIQCGFVRVEDNLFIVHDWEDVNRMLISSWNNGRLGGRPQTHGKPMENRQGTHGKPTSRARGREEDKIRAGYPVGYSQNRDASRVTRSESAVPPGKEEEKADPENVKKFGQLMKGLSDQLRGGTDSSSQVENL